MNWDKLADLVRDGYVAAKRHDTLPLTLYDYTPKTQFDRLWCDETLTCRGLVADDNGEFVSRSLTKFFNVEEHLAMGRSIPNEAYDVFEKLDGSFVGVSLYKGHPIVHTRGSFQSDQALYATKLLDERYGVDWVDPTTTYAFELIAPWNRIVVDYGTVSDLVLLAAFETASGIEQSRGSTTWTGPLARRVLATTLDNRGPYAGVPQGSEDGGADLLELKQQIRDDEEGFVIRFASGLRLKLKGAEYLRLHRLVTGVNEKAIWEMMREGQDLSLILDRVPDEYYEWVKGIEKDLRKQHIALRSTAEQYFADLINPHRTRVMSRKDFAVAAQRCAFPHKYVLFLLWDDRPIGQAIWELIKPKSARAFFEKEAA